MSRRRRRPPSRRRSSPRTAADRPTHGGAPRPATPRDAVGPGARRDPGGNSTAIGARAAVVVPGIAEPNRPPLPFRQFTPYGLIV